MHVDRDRLKQHIIELASSPRPAESPELELARSYCASQLKPSGWRIAEHSFTTRSEQDVDLRGINLIAEHADHPVADNGPRFCVGAHLDSRPDSPGADDNGSAVATLLEIARLLPDNWPGDPKISLELVLFDLEENGMLGGAEHARIAREQHHDLRGMVSLEMLGYCDHRPDSQALPRSLVGLYPDTGNFIAVIGNQNSEALIAEFASGMKEVEGLPVETLAVPENGDYLQATRLSDHSPFWDAGFAALMITDTSFLRNPYYHTPEDTVETLDFDFLELVAQGSLEAVHRILDRGL